MKYGVKCAACGAMKAKDEEWLPLETRQHGEITGTALACSFICGKLLMYRFARNNTLGLVETENEAIEAAIPAVGEYIESVGKRDFHNWTYQEFQTLIEVVWTNVHENMPHGKIPF